MSEQTENVPERRDFLASAAFWATAGTMAFAAVGIARMPKPGVLPGQSSLLKIGLPGEYPVSAEPVRVPGQRKCAPRAWQLISVIWALPKEILYRP